jgi:hypothetical protein
MLYLTGNVGYPWNGLVSVEETPSGGEAEAYYYDGVKTLDVILAEDCAFSISAFTYPPEWEDYTGHVDILTGQLRMPFGFSFRQGDELHIVYNTTSQPSPETFTTQNESIEPTTFSWQFVSKPIEVPGMKSTPHIVVDLSLADPEAISDLEDFLYGTEITPPSLPTIDELLDIFAEHSIFVVVVHVDGSWTATGPDDWFVFPTPTSFEITSPSVDYLDSETYNISSY